MTKHTHTGVEFELVEGKDVPLLFLGQLILVFVALESNGGEWMMDINDGAGRLPGYMD